MLMVLSNNDIPCPPTQEAVQIHHVPDHWVMSCSFGGSVAVYDSANTTLTPPLRRQIAQVYRPLATGPDKIIPVKVRRCQKQMGGKDCGLFAIANTIALINGVDPATVKFQQAKMRKHLQQCLESGFFTMFPHMANDPTSHTNRSRNDVVSLNCLCKNHHPGAKTFQCKSCKVNYHLMCVKPSAVNKLHLTANTSNNELCPKCKV